MGFLTAIVAWVQTLTPEIAILAVMILAAAFFKRAMSFVHIIEMGLAVTVLLTAANLAPQWFNGG